MVPDLLRRREDATPIPEVSLGGVCVRVFIEWLRDRVVMPRMQRTLYTNAPCQKVLSLESRHAPFLAVPEELAARLAGS